MSEQTTEQSGSAARMAAFNDEGYHQDTPRTPTRRAVVVIATIDGEAGQRELSRERYIGDSIGAALDAHAPDPAPGARFVVEYVGRGRCL